LSGGKLASRSRGAKGRRKEVWAKKGKKGKGSIPFLRFAYYGGSRKPSKIKKKSEKASFLQHNNCSIRKMSCGLQEEGKGGGAKKKRKKSKRAPGNWLSYDPSRWGDKPAEKKYNHQAGTIRPARE